MTYVSQDPVDDVLILNASDDFDVPAVIFAETIEHLMNDP